MRCNVPEFDFERLLYLRRTALLLLVAAALVASGGCGRAAWQARTYPASGQITINGQAPAGAVVTLHSLAQKVDERNSTPWAIVQQDGTFSLSTYENGDGAPSGQYAVTVKWPLDVNDMAAAMIDRLDGAYANVDRSQWKVTIEERDNRLAPIEITGAKLKSEQNAKPHRRAPPGLGAQAK